MVIDAWRQRQGETLLPIQTKAVRQGLLDPKNGVGATNKTSLLVSGPTSSGKSFCAEMAAIKALAERRRAVILVPLKALAGQKLRLFEKTYGPLGIRCLAVTADHPENNIPFSRGEYDIAVAIYEKFDLALTAGLDILANVGLVVVDEIQCVSEPGRGVVLERLLTKIMGSSYSPRLLGLSAVLGSQSEAVRPLADWLDADVVEEMSRPVDLIRGVASGGSFRYRSFNSGLEGDEPFAASCEDDDQFETFLTQVKKDGGSTLVFLKSRRDTVQYAFRAAAGANWPEATSAIRALDDEEPSFMVRSLRQALSRGVAFHNSDVSPRQRAIVEKAFCDGEVRALFSTTTLAMGVNLTADTVYLETVKYSAGQYGDRPELVPVSRAEFDNMTGRAGRLGLCDQDRRARAIVMAHSEFDRDILWENYIVGETATTVNSVLSSVPPEDWLLDFIAAGLIGSEEDIPKLFDRTLLAQETDSVCPDCDLALTRLAEMRLIERSGSELTLTSELVLTSLGRAAALGGLTIEQVEYLLQQLESGWPHTEAGWIALVLGTPGWTLPPGILTRFEHLDGLPLKMLYQQFEHLTEETSYFLPASHRRRTLTHRQAATLKVLLALQQWRSLTPIGELEEIFQMHAGQFHALGETMAYLLGGLRALLEVTGSGPTEDVGLADLVFSLRHGMPIRLRELQDRFGEILNRSDIFQLDRLGVQSVAGLVEYPLDDLGNILNTKKQDAIRELLIANSQEDSMRLDSSLAGGSGAVAIPAVPDSIEVDGSFDGDRYLIKVNGFPIRLTGKSFKYFTKLAWSRLGKEAGWIYKDDIEVGFNQARYLYRMKNEISGGLGFLWPILENNRLGYYRLNADPAKIRINFGNLSQHQDIELRQLSTGGGSDQAC